MADLARFGVILILVLGFPLHNFVARVAGVGPGECVLMVAEATDEDGGQAVPDKPSPSCKVIAAGPHGAVERLAWSGGSVRPQIAEELGAHWWPGGPEKPPKRS